MESFEKRIGSVVHILALALGLVMALATPAAADDVFRVTVPAANLREAPTISSAVVGRVERGTILRVIAIESGWARVVLPAPGGLERVAYIATTLGVMENIPVTTPPAGAAPQAAARAPAPPPAAVDPPPAPPAAATVAEATLQQAPPPPIQRSQAPRQQTDFVRREPVVALLLSALWPGVGQFYNGPSQQTKGIIMAGVAAGTFIGALASASSCYDGCAGPAVLLLGYFGTTVYSIYDAATTAGRLNREHGLAFEIRPEQLHGRTGLRAAARYSMTF